MSIVCCDALIIIGREELFELTMDALGAAGIRDVLVKSGGSQGRDGMACIALYLGYSFAQEDGDYRKGYDILYAALSVYEDAEKLSLEDEYMTEEEL